MIRPTIAEVDLSAIRYNISNIRSRVGQNVKIIPAVKANGYGHGAVQVSKACIDASANMLGVACLEEAIELREAGFDTPILILGCLNPTAAEYVTRYNIQSTICDFKYAKMLSDAAVKQNKKVAVHVKVDTGMGRIGISADSAVDFIKSVIALPNIYLMGVFTHFPSADEADKEYTYKQIAIFNKLILDIKSQGVVVPMFHSSNSGAILAFPEADYDAVRPGIMVYGSYPSEEVVRSIAIREALTLKSKIVFLKEVAPETSISYGRTFTTKRRSKIATVPIGYADGYPRALSNKGEVAVKGVRAPVVGRVCMDQTLIDVTDVPDVQVGDDVVLYGGGFDFLSVSKIASMIGTISYELFCAISPRVSRVYLNG